MDIHVHIHTQKYIYDIEIHTSINDTYAYAHRHMRTYCVNGYSKGEFFVRGRLGVRISIESNQ